MKIVSWNCQGKFREKFKEIKKLNADIYVIQECEDPKRYIKKEYGTFANNYLWIGDKSGLGIFASKNIKIKLLDWPAYCLKYFLPVEIDNQFTLLAVWTKRQYIEEYYIYQYINKNHYDKNMVIIGDFNSNSIWDYKHGERNHTVVVEQLNEIGLVSAYHHVNKLPQGEEKNGTFYMNRKLEKPYYIDYAFLAPNKIKNFHVCSKTWLNYSDHVPIIVEK